MSVRKFRPFTEDELAIIKKNSGKITLTDLSVLLDIHYGNLTSALKQHKVPFESYKKPKVMPKRESSSMNESTNAKGEEILTDAMMKEWYN